METNVIGLSEIFLKAFHFVCKRIPLKYLCIYSLIFVVIKISTSKLKKAFIGNQEICSNDISWQNMVVSVKTKNCLIEIFHKLYSAQPLICLRFRNWVLKIELRSLWRTDVSTSETSIRVWIILRSIFVFLQQNIIQFPTDIGWSAVSYSAG